jgi:hypothetical protein
VISRFVQAVFEEDGSTSRLSPELLNARHKVATALYCVHFIVTWRLRRGGWGHGAQTNALDDEFLMTSVGRAREKVHERIVELSLRRDAALTSCNPRPVGKPQRLNVIG